LIAAIHRNLAGIWRFPQPPRCTNRCTSGFAHHHLLRDLAAAHRLQSRISGQKATLHAAEPNRPEVAKARRGWKRGQSSLDPARLVFINESAAKTNMTRLRTTTMISPVRLDGSTACMTTEGATNTEILNAYAREVLVPALRPDDIVVMDKLGAHKNDRTIALIEQAGTQGRFLPADSPDLNPIEMMWSKVKALLRTQSLE
jgi:transposase